MTESEAMKQLEKKIARMERTIKSLRLDLWEIKQLTGYPEYYRMGDGLGDVVDRFGGTFVPLKGKGWP